VDRSLIYQGDFAATLVELAGGHVPANWDFRSFAARFAGDQSADLRGELVLSQMAWSCQRAVRWEDWLCLRSYHDGYHGFPPVMLFNVAADPQLQHDLAAGQAEVCEAAVARLDRWTTDMVAHPTHPGDPMQTVLQEGGPLHTRGCLPAYLARLRATGRGDGARLLERMHPCESLKN
jgi:arylsulfatase A-like enzyme